jgi:hypothetical protein
MRDGVLKSIARKKAFALSVCLIALFGAVASAAAETGSYTWSAELVAVDNAANTVTVKSRLIEEANVPDLEPGDAVMLTWSGINIAAGIRALERGTKSSYDRMTMPVEYVSSELDGRYIVFKVQIPAGDAAAIQMLEPGTWVTATSPHLPKDKMETVTSIRPYGHVG